MIDKTVKAGCVHSYVKRVCDNVIRSIADPDYIEEDGTIDIYQSDFNKIVDSISNATCDYVVGIDRNDDLRTIGIFDYDCDGNYYLIYETVDFRILDGE